MKATATGLLLLAVGVYVGGRRWQSAGAPGWVGYLTAAAEAGIVGGLADWFAVTALFRHPLGLPIPHTALLRTRKDALGRSLEQFVATNFLSESVVRDKIARLDAAARGGRWLAEPANAERVVAEAATVVRGLVAVLRDEDVQNLLEQTVVRRLAAAPLGPPAGRLLGALVAEGAHHQLVDLALDQAAGWLAEHRDAVLRVVTDQAPIWSPRFVDQRVAEKVHRELLRFVAEVRDDPEHRLRLALDTFLAQFAADLRTDPATIERAERLKARLLAHPELRQAVAALWTAIKRLLLDAAGDPSSELRAQATEAVRSLGRRLAADPELRAKADRWLVEALTHVITTYRAEVTAVITDTVNRWDAAETARKVELQVGKDLQFIRINGTVVGAIAGLVIHALTAGW